MAVLGTLAGVLAAVPSASATIGTKPLVTWQTNGRVLAIMQVGGITYVGGKFTQISDHSGHTMTVSNLAAFNGGGNPVTVPQPSAAVKAFATDGAGTIFFGGSFTKVNGSGRNHIAAMDGSGTLLPKSTFAGAANGDVEALVTSGSNLYMAGTFTSVEGSARTSLAAVALSDGSLLPWSPFVDGRVDALAVSGTEIVAGGFFTNAGSASGGHGHLAAFDDTSGSIQGNYSLPVASPVVSMAEDSGNAVYVGTTSNRVIAFNSTGTHVAWQQQFDGNVQDIAISDGEVVAGGHFDNLCTIGTNCQNPIVRHHIAALDPADGSLDTGWAPDVNSTLGVFALDDTSNGLAVGGDFTKIGGVSQTHLAWLDTGASVPVDSTAPKITAAPDAILRRATTISGGAFPLLVRYAATDASGVCAYHLQRSVGGGPYAAVSLSPATRTTRTVMLRPSTSARRYQVSATDCVGNTSSFSQGPSVRLTAFQDSNAHIHYTRAWRRGSARNAYGGSVHLVSKARAYATLRFTGRQVAWVASRAANRGTARVYLDGHLAATVNLHTSGTVRRRLVFAKTWATDGVHTLKIVCAGTHGHPTIDVDAIGTVR
jgi:hypothetical protein